jgi:hypothetical protein
VQRHSRPALHRPRWRSCPPSTPAQAHKEGWGVSMSGASAGVGTLNRAKKSAVQPHHLHMLVNTSS